MARKLDPEKQGINFMLNAGAGPIPSVRPTAGAGTAGGDPATGLPRNSTTERVAVDPATGLPRSIGTETMPTDLNLVCISLTTPLQKVRLVDVLDAIVKCADSPIEYSIEDYAVVFSSRAAPASPSLYFRTIRLDPDKFNAGLSEAAVAAGLRLPDDWWAAMRAYFFSLGVDMSPPKTMFFNDREGALLVYASLHDLDIIERAVQVLNIAPPQVNLKARFISLPEAEINAFMAQYASAYSPSNAAVRLTPSQTRKLIQRWQGMDGADLLSESEVTTLSGRQAQIQTVGLKTVVMGVQATPTNQANGSPSPLTDELPFGPTLDIIPQASADGFAVRLGMIVSVGEFLGYENPGQIVVSATSETNGIPITTALPLPHFRVHEQTATVSVWDGQSVVLGGLETTDFVGTKAVTAHTNRNHIVVVVTPTLIDPAGNRLQTVDHLPFVETSFPPVGQSTPLPGARPMVKPVPLKSDR